MYRELGPRWDAVAAAFERVRTAIKHRLEALGQHDVFASHAELRARSSYSLTTSPEQKSPAVGRGAGVPESETDGTQDGDSSTGARLRLTRSFTHGEKTRTAVSLHSQYTLGRKLGTGGYSVVYEATHIATGQKFAVKCVKKSVLSARDLASLETEVRHQKRVRSLALVLVC